MVAHDPCTLGPEVRYLVIKFGNTVESSPGVAKTAVYIKGYRLDLIRNLNKIKNTTYQHTSSS